jgi:predicted O-methyltransferase YrrM
MNRSNIIDTSPAEMTRPERMLLYALVCGLKPLRVLEIGTHTGGSSMIIVAALDESGSGELACVDPKPEIQPKHWQTIQHRARLFEAPSPQILETAANALGGLFDFAVIDGDHSRESVIRDVEGTLPLLARSAYLLFHDVHYEPVANGIKEVLRKHPSQLVDCGLLSVQRMPDPSSGVFWGGLQLLRFVGFNHRDPRFSLIKFILKRAM